jgi:predicted phosphodiesterase
MKTVILSDIHGNLVALESVLAEIERLRSDQVVCLGDVAAAGPRPVEVIDRLRQTSWRFVLGNTDAWLLDPRLTNEPTEDQRRLDELELWGSEQLGAAQRAFLESFAPSLDLDLGSGRRLCAYHGAPESFSIELLPGTPSEELAVRFAGREAELFAGGHTHEAMLRRFRSAWVLNPGSVGLPLEEQSDGSIRHPALAEWSVVDSRAVGLSVELKRTAIDVPALTADARASGMPHVEWWLRSWSNGTELT